MVESIVLSGVAIGCIYALIGITYNVMFSASRVFSFTAGTLGMLGGVFGSLFIARMGLPVAVGFLLSLVCGAIFGIAQTSDGYLWLGTEFGLLRFDGVRTTPWPSDRILPSSRRERWGERARCNRWIWISVPERSSVWPAFLDQAAPKPQNCFLASIDPIKGFF